MNRPNIEDYKLPDGGYSQKYITDLEKYCDYLDYTIKCTEYVNECLKDEVKYLRGTLNYITSKF